MIERLITLINTVAMTIMPILTMMTIMMTAIPAAQEARTSQLPITLPVIALHAPHTAAVVLADLFARGVATTADLMAMRARIRTPIGLEADDVLSEGTILEDIEKCDHKIVIVFIRCDQLLGKGGLGYG